MNLQITRPGLVVPARVARDGGYPSRWDVETQEWRRSGRGLYVPPGVTDDDVEQRIVEMAARLTTEIGGVTGWAALRWLGARWFSGLRPDQSRLPVPLLALHRQIRPQLGHLLSEERHQPGEFVIVDGLMITDPWRSVGFEMRYARSTRDAVLALDMACYADLVSIAEMAEYLSHLNGWTGVPQAREALGLGNENSWSPSEVRLRLVWEVDAELRPLLANRPLFNRDGRHIATPDLLDLEAGLAIEYDGEVHLDKLQRHRDVNREDRMRNHGLEVLTVTSGDMTNRYRLIQRMEAARARALFEPIDMRRWTVVPPNWWVDTTSVAARRALSQWDRERLLRYRAA